MDKWWFGAIWVMTLSLAYCLGWTASATIIGSECEKLGAF